MQFDRLIGRLTLLAVMALGSPAGAQDAPVALNARASADRDECDRLVADGVASARAGGKAAADRSLMAATTRCPGSAAAWRELAGLRFVDSRWSEASSFARTAVGLAPADDRAWRILAASLFMEGDTQGALRAWNRVGEPRVGAVVVSGTHRTREPVVLDRVGLGPRQLLTPEALARAVRRAEDLPVVSRALVRYFPHDADGATVEVDITERQRFPMGWASWGNIAGRALILHELRVPFGGPTGSGERIDFEYGWKRNRPRTTVRLTAPAPGFLPGLIVLEASRSRHTFLVPAGTGDETLRLERRDGRIGFEDWATHRVHWKTDGMFTELPGRRRFFGLGGGLDTRWLDDHVSVELEGAAWRGIGETPGFRTAELKAHWRQKVTRTPMGWRADAGATAATDDAPLVFWAGADVGSSQEAFLRAHKFMTDGIVTSRIFGRQLVFGSVSYERPVATIKAGTIGLVGFVDTAKAWNGLTWERADAQVDIGIGARLHAVSFGSVRVDVGYGLRDGGIVVSAGFVRPWPRR